MPLISIVIYILVFALACGIIYWIWTLLPLPPPAKNIVLCALLIVLLIAIIYYLPTFVPLRR